MKIDLIQIVFGLFDGSFIATTISATMKCDSLPGRKKGLILYSSFILSSAVARFVKW